MNENDSPSFLDRVILLHVYVLLVGKNHIRFPWYTRTTRDRHVLKVFDSHYVFLHTQVSSLRTRPKGPSDISPLETESGPKGWVPRRPRESRVIQTDNTVNLISPLTANDGTTPSLQQRKGGILLETRMDSPALDP